MYSDLDSDVDSELYSDVDSNVYSNANLIIKESIKVYDQNTKYKSCSDTIK